MIIFGPDEHTAVFRQNRNGVPSKYSGVPSVLARSQEARVAYCYCPVGKRSQHKVNNTGVLPVPPPFFSPHIIHA